MNDKSSTMEVLLPQLGFSIEESKLSEWLVKDGDNITRGQPIFTLESDKAVEEIEAEIDGTIHLIAKEGEIYKVGDVLATIDPA